MERTDKRQKNRGLGKLILSAAQKIIFKLLNSKIELFIVTVPAFHQVPLLQFLRSALQEMEELRYQLGDIETF